MAQETQTGALYQPRGGIWEGGSQGRGYMYIDSASLVAQMLKHLSAVRETWFDPWVRKIPWRSKWQPSPVLLPGKSHRRRSLVGYSPWGCKESDTTEQLHFHFIFWTLSINDMPGIRDVVSTLFFLLRRVDIYKHVFNHP